MTPTGWDGTSSIRQRSSQGRSGFRLRQNLPDEQLLRVPTAAPTSELCCDTFSYCPRARFAPPERPKHPVSLLFCANRASALHGSPLCLAGSLPVLADFLQVSSRRLQRRRKTERHAGHERQHKRKEQYRRIERNHEAGPTRFEWVPPSAAGNLRRGRDRVSADGTDPNFLVRNDC